MIAVGGTSPRGGVVRGPIIGPLLWLLAAACPCAADPGLQFVRAIALPGVEGRLDHMAIDGARRHLFVTALTSDTVLDIDLSTGAVVHHLTGLREPQGIAYLPGADRIAVASGGNGSCRFFDANTLREAGAVDLGEDADNLRFDSAGNRLYVGAASGALDVIDAAAMTRVSEIALPSHPEAFELATEGSRVFVNVPAASLVEVVDRDRQAVVDSWALPPACNNFPMALDEGHHRLFVGCRNPPETVVMDTVTGTVTGTFDVARDIDDLFWDPRSNAVVASGGEGFVDVFVSDRQSWRRVQRLATASGARTSLLVAGSQEFYLAVPHRGEQSAEVRVYLLRP